MTKLLYYSAPWCAPCKTQWPTTQRAAEKLSLSIEKREIDAESAKYWGIQSIPTLLVLIGEEEVFRHVGNISEDRLVETLSNYR